MKSKGLFCLRCDKLIGMICVMDDGIMNACVHYLLADPDCQEITLAKLY